MEKIATKNVRAAELVSKFANKVINPKGIRPLSEKELHLVSGGSKKVRAA